MIRRLLPLAFLACAVVPAFASDHPDTIRVRSSVRVREAWAERYQTARQGPEVTDRFSRTVRIGRTGAFELSNISGDIVVTGGTGDDVKIDAVLRARSRDDEDAKRLLSELRVEVIDTPNRVEVRTQYPRNRRNFSGSVDYTIALPQGASANLRSVSGDIRVTNVRGELRAESVSGDMVTSGATQLSLVKTVSGDIQVSDATAAGEVTVSTVSGTLTARGLKARAVDLSSVSGDVLLTNVSAERATISSVSGNIEYNGELLRNGRYEMSSHSGDVRLAVAEATGFELEATTFSGDVRSDFPLTLRAGGDEGTGNRGRRNRSIRGSYGDASALVDLKSFSGDIVVTKR